MRSSVNNLKPINPKYLGEGGIHRVPLWRIAGFALNNTATNIYLLMMMYVSYYMIGIVGVATVFASSFSMIMRLWDGVTDPFVGYMVDKTNGKLGKNRPYMIIGNVILASTSFIMFYVTPSIPEGVARIAFFIVINAIYYLGYTAQCVVTKSAQTALTNDPKQRPLFSVFDGTYNTILFAVGALFITGTLIPKYGDSFYEIGWFREMWVWFAAISAVFTIIAVISISPKDRTEFFGTGQSVRVGIKDYWDILKNNRAIQMLVLAASTDKLGVQARSGAPAIVLYGVVAGNIKLQGGFTLYSSIGSLILLILGVGGFATRFGQRKAMITASIGAIIGNASLALLWIFGDPTTLGFPGIEGYAGLTSFTIALVALTIVTQGLQNVAGGIVIPMTADCADYETYRSGRYVPGLMGTLFSFVDKMVSSLAPLVVGLVFAAIGFADKLPDATTPYSVTLRNAGVFLTYGLISIGLIMNIVAMKFYPLTKEKMEEIQVHIAKIKEEAIGLKK